MIEKQTRNIIEEKEGTQEEHFAFIKSSVEDGSYFKDALSWYFFRYVTPICDRTLLIFGAAVGFVVLYFLYQMIQSAFPLVERIPIFVNAKDQSVYFPNISPLRPHSWQENYDQEVKSVDEAVLKRLLSVYISDRESYDFSKAEASEVNIKFDRVKNQSSSEEYRNFQLIMSPDNPNSPIKNFGQPIIKFSEVESVKFVRKAAKGLTNQAKQFLLNEVPTEAEVRFFTIVRTSSEKGNIDEKERYLAKVKFDFEAVKKEQKGPIKFTVNSYKLYKIK
jgi:type IV secretory pathway component VirB8